MSRENFVRVSINRDFPDGGHNGGGFATKISQDVDDPEFQYFSEKQYEIASRIWEILQLIGVSCVISMLDAMKLPQIAKAVAILSDAWLKSDRSNEFDDCCQFDVHLERLYIDLRPNSVLTTEQKLLVSKLLEQGANVLLYGRMLDENGNQEAPAYTVGSRVGCLAVAQRQVYTVKRPAVFDHGQWWYWLVDDNNADYCIKESDLYSAIVD